MCESTFSGHSAGGGSDCNMQRRAFVYPVSIIVWATHSVKLLNLAGASCFFGHIGILNVCVPAGAGLNNT